MGAPVVVAGVVQPDLVAAPAQAGADAFPGLVSVAVREPGKAQLGVHLPEPVGGGRGEIAKALFARAQRLLGALALGDLVAQIQTGRVQLDQLDHDAGKIEQQEPLFGEQASWRMVDDAQDADVVAVLGGQRRAGVETDVRRSRDQGTVGKARIRARIGNLQDAIAEDGEAAHRTGPECLLQRHAVARLEPLPLLIHERDQGDRRRQQARGHAGDRIENGIGRRIQDGVPAQGLQPRAFLRRHARLRVAPARRRLVHRCFEHRAYLCRNYNDDSIVSLAIP